VTLLVIKHVPWFGHVFGSDTYPIAMLVKESSEFVIDPNSADQAFMGRDV